MFENIFQSAQKLEKELKWEDAAKNYVQLVDTSPSALVYERIAWCFSRAGEYKKAIEYLFKLHELDASSAKWLYMIGYQYYCQKKWLQAIEWFEKALEGYPDYFVVKYRLAYAYTQVAGISNKLTKFEFWKVLGHLQDCHRLWNTFDEQKRQKESTIYFDVNFLHGKILMKLPRYYSESIRLFKTALSINPNDEFAQYNLAKGYYLNCEYQQAKDNIPPNGSQYYIVELNAHIEAKLGNYQKAIDIVKQLLQRRTKDYLYTFLAEVYLLSNELDAAFIAAKQAVLLGKKNHKNFYIVAKVYYRYGLLNKALEYIQFAIKIKQTVYEASYIECEELKENILQEKSSNYQEDLQLVARLNNMQVSEDIGKFEQGVICRYNTEKGFGFIKTSSQDIFFHVSNCKFNDILVGNKVEFMNKNTEKGLMAIDVKRIN